MPADLGYDIAHPDPGRPREETEQERLQRQFSTFDAYEPMLNREHPYERRQRERGELIVAVAQELQRRLNTLVGAPINEASDRAHAYVNEAEARLRDGGVDDIDISISPHPRDRDGVVVSVLRRAPAQVVEFSGEAVPRRIRASVDVQGAMDEALEGLTPEQRQELAAQVETGLPGVQTREDEAEVYGRMMADAYARRLNELGLDPTAGDTGLNLDRRIIARANHLLQTPKEEKDTTDNFTPRRKLEID